MSLNTRSERADRKLFTHQRMMVNSLWRPSKGDLFTRYIDILRIDRRGETYDETWIVTCNFWNESGAEFIWKLAEPAEAERADRFPTPFRESFVTVEPGTIRYNVNGPNL